MPEQLAAIIWKPRKWQRSALQDIRDQPRSVVSAAPGNGCQSLALAVCACVLAGDSRRSVLLVGPTQAAAAEAAGRILPLLGIRPADGRRKSARSTQSRKLGQRFRQRSSHLGARIEAMRTRSVLRTTGARGAWPDDVDLVVAIRVGEWPTSQAGKLHDVGRYLATGSRPADALHPFEVLCRSAMTDPERGIVYAADPEAADQDPLDTDVWQAANQAGELHEGIRREVEAARTALRLVGSALTALFPSQCSRRSDQAGTLLRRFKKLHRGTYKLLPAEPATGTLWNDAYVGL